MGWSWGPRAPALCNPLSSSVPIAAINVYCSAFLFILMKFFFLWRGRWREEVVTFLITLDLLGRVCFMKGVVLGVGGFSFPFRRIAQASGHCWGPFLLLSSVCGAQVSWEPVTGGIWCGSSQGLCLQEPYSLIGHRIYTGKTEGGGKGSVERQTLSPVYCRQLSWFCLQFWSRARLHSVTWISTPESWVKEADWKDTELWKAGRRTQQSFQADFSFVTWKLNKRKVADWLI